jgi:hypothetical protein
MRIAFDASRVDQLEHALGAIGKRLELNVV